MLLGSLILLPLLGGLGAWMVAGRSAVAARWTALASTLATGLSCVVAVQAAGVSGPGGLTATTGAFSLAALRLDGLSVPLVALTAGLGVVAVLASWNVAERPGAFFALLLALQAAVTAVFLADDLILFYVAWEAVLVPMFFLIGRWGHEGRKHAALKFFLFTFAGSAFMLVGLLLLIRVTGTTSMSGTLSWLRAVPAVAPGLPVALSARAAVFWLLAIGFAVKIPVWPLHTWLPDAHVESPTAGSIMLAGVLLKMGGYGFLRIGLTVSPEAAKAASGLLATLGVIGIVYGALMALAQSDLKRVVAYSSVAHMGFMVLAIAVGTPLALTAAMLVMIAHGVISALLFLLVGLMEERTHTRELARLGGLLRVAPAWGTAFVFASLASLGLPGLAGFPGELATFLESFDTIGWWVLAVAAGVVLAGAYSLRAVRRVAHGPLPEEWAGLKDLDLREALAVAPLVAAAVVLGVWPSLVTSVTAPLVMAVARVLGRG